MIARNFIHSVLLVVLAFLLTASPLAQYSVAAEKDIVDTAVSAGSFKTLVAAVEAAGLVETLKSKGPFTVFAPTDDAFKKVPKDAIDALLKPENKDKLTAILTYHVVPGKVMAADVVKMKSAETVNGQMVSINAKGDTVMIDNAKVIKTDIKASNGVIHVIDTVILPKDIVDTAIAAGAFETLVAAVKAAGLVETLKGEGPFTVFAPTDDAFKKLPAGTVENLLKPENKDKLIAILTYHVIPGEVMSSDILKIGTAKTVNGQEISIGLNVDSAKVIKADIKCANGIIHVIDNVILPKEK
jgi:uncharacterized surface protein with fasciclin (FAS1) repeats